MGGDSAPAEPVRGAVLAAREYGLEVLLCGPEAVVEAELKKAGRAPPGITVVPAGGAIPMTEARVVQAVRQRQDASINVATGLVRQGRADAVVSAGHTGAVMASALFVLGRIKGIERPALGTLLPFNQGRVFLIDIGANPDCKPAYLVQFGQMGAAYLEKVIGIHNPRVGLLNVGTEDTKGNDLAQESFQLLQRSGLNFIGNVEGANLHDGIADVVVSDGFTGNVGLKVGEGIADYILEQVRSVIKSSPLFLAASLLLRPALRRALRRLNYDEYGGALLLGVNGVVVIAHGRSDANAVKNAVRVAKAAAEKDLVATIAAALGLTEKTAQAVAP
jgi:glycerol-3-phosphate acyltransferase PlsX